MRELIISTGNEGKYKEIVSTLGDTFDRYYSLGDFDEKVVVEEDSPLYFENAMKKARKVGDRFNMATLADDSGLEIEALGGKPGVLSARYGIDDKDRIERVLQELNGVPWEKRGAVFKAYIALYMPDKGWVYIFYGQIKGFIGFEAKGDLGFGYDPIFYIPQLGKYLAELEMETKNRISHRGKALNAMKEFLNADFFIRSRKR
ncbi:MAG: RdgB/HAM1 family non-canonical purine NTP pyrophosphatase [Syntrophorhabdaceae bacterium]|nr:RdgB/HAM1 family non-canonical purine NTP pyrophosphatase [Syntrophorhabdaceae bacterium]